MIIPNNDKTIYVYIISFFQTGWKNIRIKRYLIQKLQLNGPDAWYSNTFINSLSASIKGHTKYSFHTIPN